MKKVFLVSMLASMMFLNTACDESDIVAGVIGVGIGVGIAAGSHDHDRRHDYNDGYRDGRHDGYRNGRRDGGHHGRGRHRRYAAETTFSTPIALQNENSEVLAFAERYRVSTTAAQKVQVAFDSVKAKGVDAFAPIGLSKKDLRAIAKRELPASSSLKTMAAKLDISEAQSRDLVQDMIQEFDAQASDVNSPYWQACIGKGRWRTDDNLYCKKTAWNKCSPATGAKLCY